MSGALQAAITKTLDGRSGLAGWRWLFVINAIMTVVWGFAGFAMIPDLPNKPNPRAVWFKKTHAELSIHLSWVLQWPGIMPFRRGRRF